MDPLDKGFEFRVERERRLLRFRMWGLWEAEDAAAFKVAFRRHHALLDPGPFQIYVDLVHFPAQLPEITELVKEEMKYAADQGLTRAGHAVDAAMTQFQIRRMGSESHSLEFGFFATEAEALAWLDEHAAAV